MTDEIKITASEYEEIQRNLKKLYALEAGGVDNWEWFDESLKEWRKENQEAELISNFEETIKELLADADVDEPAGRGCGYSISFSSSEFKKLVKEFISQIKSIED